MNRDDEAVLRRNLRMKTLTIIHTNNVWGKDKSGNCTKKTKIVYVAGETSVYFDT